MVQNISVSNIDQYIIHSIEEMTKLMDTVFSDTSLHERGDDGILYIKTDDDRVQQLLNYLDDLIIVPNGSVNYQNIQRVNQYGYRIYPGERDSFGWITGCVRKGHNGPILLFG